MEKRIAFSISSEQAYKATLIQEKFKLTPRQQAMEAYKKYLDSFSVEGLLKDKKY